MAATGGAADGIKRLGRATGIAVVCLALLLAALLAALHLPRVQRSLFARAAAIVEARNGIRVTADSVRLWPLGIRLELIGPSFAAAGAEPFLTADSLVVEVAPGSLVRGPLLVREVVIVGPRLDAARPLPLPPASPAAEPGETPAISVERLRLRDGAAAGLELPPALGALLGAVTLADIELDGSLVDGQLELALRRARLRAAPEGRPPLDLALEAELAGPLTGPLRLDRLQVDGEGLTATASGRLGLAEEQPLQVALEARADLTRLLGADAAAAPVRLSGELDLRMPAGELRLEADRLPAELATGFLTAERFAASGLAGSELSLAVSLAVRHAGIEGVAEARWLRGERLLALAGLTAEGELPGRELPVQVELELLPNEPGERRVEAELLLSREAPDGGRIERGRLRLSVPDLEAELARLGELWPGRLPVLPAGLAAGPLRLGGGFSGRLTDPAVRLAGEWLPTERSSVRLSASGRVAARRLEGSAEVTALPLSRLAGGAEGTLAGAGRIALTGDRLTGDLWLEGSGMRQGGFELDRARLTAALADARVRIDELLLEQPGRKLRGTGVVELGRTPTVELALALEGGWGALRSAEGRLRLADGVARLELPRADLGGSPASLSATAPLATLSSLPGGEALAALAGDGAGGPLEVEWQLPAIDWLPAVAGEGAAEADRWVVGSRGRLAIDPASPATGDGEVELRDLDLMLGGRTLRAAGPVRLGLAAGRLELAPTAIELDARPIRVAGEARLRAAWSAGDPPARLVEEARLTAGAAAPPPLESFDLALLLRDERLRLDLSAPLREGGGGQLQAAAPLSALTGGVGRVELSWRLPAADWAGWLPEPDGERVVDRLVAGVEGRLELEPARPALATGELRIPRLELELGDESLRARGPIVLRLGDGRLAVESAQLTASGAPLELAGWIDLEPEWQPGAPVPELVRELALTGGGVVPAALLNPFLAGGAGEGTLRASLQVAGGPQSVRGEVELTGDGAGFFFVSPYPLEVAAPRLTLRLADGRAAFDGSARVNEGKLSFDGAADKEDGLTVAARLEAVRAVLDYGLLTLLDGDLRLRLAADGSGLLGGRLTVDSGQLTRPLRLDSLLLDQLLPADLLGSELDPLEQIALDLTVATRQGVRVKNNLADLKVSWEPISVRGNLVEPILEGRLEVDPGGLVYAYGQTVRLDAAALVYRGLPQEAPTLELQTTTSLEDPTIGRLAGNDPFGEARVAPSGDVGGGDGAAAQALTAGLASFVGEQLDSSLAETLGGARISFRPLPIFGEADPGARLTASTDLSAYATLAASLDLRNAERQTYLLDLHDEQAAARLSAQLFTNDLGGEGSTLQQRLEFGGSRRRATGPRLRRLRFDPVPGVRRRALRRAAAYRKGDRLADGAAFEIAVAVGEALRDRGYPDARVRVAESPARAGRGVELAVRIDSGPRVEFRFTGEKLPKPLRRAITDLYRGDFYESAALEEMRAEAVRAWRSRGHLDPRVTVRREPLPGGPPERRRVTIDSFPGERVELAAPRFVGLPASESAELASLFDSSLRRAELAAGLEAAERRALSGLSALGYPEAAISGRRLSPDRGRLTVEVAPGERLRVASVIFVGPGGRMTEVGEAGGVKAGDAVRSDRLARAALEVERELRAAGYLDAEVSLRLEPVDEGAAHERQAVFALDRGPLYRLAATEFAGLDSTRPAWARRIVDLAEGEPLAPEELRRARRRLYGTGLFSAVGSTVGDPQEDGVRVRFEVEEEPRFQVGYGVRWQSEEGSSLVVDLLDRNFLGRGVDLGLRALAADDVRQLRLSASIPEIFGPKSRLDLFASGSEEERIDFSEVLTTRQILEGTVQLSWQFGPRTTGRVYGRYREVRSEERSLVDDPFFIPFNVRARRPFLGLQYIFDSREGRVAPRRGLFASLDVSFGDEALGGDLSYGRLFGQLNSFRPAGRLAGRRLTWAQSVRLGHAEAFSGQELVGDLLLRGGGEYSVRGYLRETLGPPVLVGGAAPSTVDNSLFVLNEELRFEIWDLLSGLLFFDAGNVWIDQPSEVDLFTSLGVGLRADTPFGLLRLDVALPLDRRPEVDPDIKIYFGLGNVF